MLKEIHLTCAEIQRFLKMVPQKRIAVIGDLMLDRYVWGSASRLSQEAPVPVVAIKKETAAPGGSANVVLNLACLGAKVVPFGAIGQDAQGEQLSILLRSMSETTQGIIVDASRRTTVKTRVMAGTQQVVRVDAEDIHELTQEYLEQIVGQLKCEAEKGLDAIIVEDYAKGLITKDLLQAVVDVATARDIPVALDPHARKALNVKGLTVITPNRNEAFALAGVPYEEAIDPLDKDEALLKVATRLEENWKPDHVLATLGAGGMALFREGAPCLHIPTKAQEVFDVSGAGDTVIATYVLGFVSGFTPEQAASIANSAAGIVVAKVGTTPIQSDWLLAEYEHES